MSLPSDFIVTPSIKPTTTSDAQSYYFTSPDGEVEFYVYKSYWGGEDTEIAIDPDKEEYITAPKVGHGGEIVRYDIQALDSSYKRAYLEVQSQKENTHLVKGIKYKSQSAYNTYYPVFRSFFKTIH